jgi:DnaK suppressor protein
MLDSKKQELLEKINEAISSTQNEIEQLEELTKPIAPENSLGRVSRMDAINNKGVSEATLRTARRKLSGLQIAQSRIDAKDFGICERCKNPIPFARLMYMPESARCVHCAGK